MAAIDERVLRTRNSIARAVVALGSERQVDKLTVGEICHHAGISRSTFYGHYSSLGDYLVAAYANMVANCVIRGGLEAQGTGKVLAVHRLLEHIHHSRHYALSVEQSRQRPRMQAAGELRLRAIARQNLKVQMPKLTDEQREAAATFIVGGFMSLLRRWTAEGLNRSPEAIDLEFQAMADALLEGLANNRDRAPRAGVN